MCWFTINKIKSSTAKWACIDSSTLLWPTVSLGTQRMGDGGRIFPHKLTDLLFVCASRHKYVLACKNFIFKVPFLEMLTCIPSAELKTKMTLVDCSKRHPWWTGGHATAQLRDDVCISSSCTFHEWLVLYTGSSVCVCVWVCVCVCVFVCVCVCKLLSTLSPLFFLRKLCS